MTDWFVSIFRGGNGNGGSSNVVRSAANDGVANATTLFTSASAAWTSADIGHAIAIFNASGYYRRKITGVPSATSLTLASALPFSASSLTYTVGGPVGTLQDAIGRDFVSHDTCPIVSGDHIYVAAGRYPAVVDSYVEPTGTITIHGDIHGVKTGEPGEVIFDTWVSGLKLGGGSGSAGRAVQLYGQSFWAFEYITFDGSDVVVDSTSSLNGPLNRSFKYCHFYNQYATSESKGLYISPPNTFGTALNTVIDSCIFFCVGLPLDLHHPNAAAGSAYDVNIVIKNSLIIALGSPSFNMAINITPESVNTVKSGGVYIDNCFIVSPNYAVSCADISTSFPVTIRNCRILGSLIAGAAGQIVEDYNWIVPCLQAARTNVSTGTHSKGVSYNGRFHMGMEYLIGMMPRPFGQPIDGSPMLGFGTDAGVALGVDIFGGPRPAGGGSALKAIGPLERANTAIKETTTIRSGATSLKLTGPGYQDFQFPVDAAATTISVYARYDATYAGTKPQLQVLNGSEVGVADATASFGDGRSDADPGSGAWGRLRLLTFAPTAKSYVTIRILSNDTNGAGGAFFDDFQIQ